MFVITPQDPELYRRQTRRSTLIIALVFIALAMLFSSAAVAVFGQPGGDNLVWNAGGVFTGLVISAVLLRTVFWTQPWMASAVYGWRLKRSLMRVTNVMHHVTAGVAASDPAALKLLRFYHLGLTQMHQLDANSSAHGQMLGEVERHLALLAEQGIDPQQERLEAQWLEAVKVHQPR
ncbi:MULTISPECIES: DUF3087 domain-containing protein [Pseudomonas]|uniref:DUF3087 domain-containing protein n=1 Tax=Pseudomonas idahonensis TaxID=2942628 RepID=A0ABT5Q6X3_9PSED|nr:MULTISPECIES: DUF3087 domain-containing protein [Pseudomonas]MDC7814771.1 DUF3087 domain-containing protein [Pseudomonas sp. BLCC-B112]MDD1149948.1 DUF3087 domain-containing protein [Pseudomonas idahonensis]ROL90882.1 hypothetical protein BK639_19950 [Pseudomonas protegens]ROL96518.1 hypothetical protein BK640_27640 [Pseudomonas protegens]ROL98419.1 hypothetical protein BK641_29985 [Pseudomonas protegens]